MRKPRESVGKTSGNEERFSGNNNARKSSIGNPWMG